MKDSIIQDLKKEIAQIKNDASFSHFGEVVKISDGVVSISGLSEVRYSEMIEFEDLKGNKIPGVALNLEEDLVGAIVLGDPLSIGEGCKVKNTGKILSISVGNDILGRVVDGLGVSKDGSGALKEAKLYPLEKIAPGVITRESVGTPLHTGIKAVDAMIPVGRGQRQLIIGDRTTGKTAIALDTIIHQKKEKNPPSCVYVAIGQK
mgnify:FL=1